MAREKLIWWARRFALLPPAKPHSSDVMPAQAGIQYAAAHRDDHNCPGVLDRPVESGDDSSPCRADVDRSRSAHADLRIALSTRVLPSDQIAPGTLWLWAITSSKARSIQLQSSSVIVSDGSSLMVCRPWPATWVRIL
ncbi:hypothetical protein ACVIJ6_007148 [Bradyrhizobium sp. USDA 4369]